MSGLIVGWKAIGAALSAATGMAFTDEGARALARSSHKDPLPVVRWRRSVTISEEALIAWAARQWSEVARSRPPNDASPGSEP